jgi:YidC/Oxa1 family membrane protein insertase
MFDALYLVLIYPIKLLLLFVLNQTYQISGSYGFAILMLSLAFNLLLLPAYHWAEKVQNKERDIQRRMRPKIDEFKFAFHGQERYWMLRTLYRQHHYHPFYALRALLPLAIQVPFFIATFGLLANYTPLVGVGFLGLRDLSQPDHLLFGLNVMPILMTTLNVIAVHLYSRQLPVQERLQSYVIAVIFLVLLYQSPVGLVMYWTVSNAISVVKSLVYAKRHPVLSSNPNMGPVGLSLQPARLFQHMHAALQTQNQSLHWLLSMGVLVTLFIALPAALTGFEDNVDGLKGFSWFYLGNAALACAGFVLLTYCLARMLPGRARTGYIFIVTSCLLMSVMFGFICQIDAGVLDNFIFAKPEALALTVGKIGMDGVIVLSCLALACYLLTQCPNWVANAMVVLLISDVILAGMGLYSIEDRASKKSETALSRDTKLYSYSKQGKNVLLIFIDGAMSGYMRDILQQDPALADNFAGFTWYSNVVSTGNRTINALPALFGGFDYSVSEVNRRQAGLLKDKVSNAYKLYVDNFSQHGYQVLYSDPFWFGFERKGDCELFNNLYEKTEQGRCIHAIGKNIDEQKDKVRDHSKLFQGLLKQYLALSIFKIAPSAFKESIYSGGEWMGLSYGWKKKEEKYLNNYFSLGGMGQFSDTLATRDTFTFVANELTRAPLFLKDDCIPDNKLTASAPQIHGLITQFKDEETAAIYQTTRCTVQGVGQYMAWLKKNGVYDNTMVVVASDHGWLSHNPLLQNVSDQVRYSMFQSFLMVKPFAQNAALQESKEFIANANVPGIICEVIGGCLDHATGKTVRARKLEGSVLLHETPWQPSGQQADAYVIDAMYRVQQDITKSENWQRVSQPIPTVK